MKLIILAAGQGSRLWKYTRQNPKGMIEFAGKSLLKHQIDLFRKKGITDISIVTGYKKEKIIFDDIKYYVNDNFLKTNMVTSLMCAQAEFNDDCIVSYSDLIFEEKVIDEILGSDYEIGITVDKDFNDYWKCRLGESYSDDLESLVISENMINSIGNPNPTIKEIDGRYVGLIRFSKAGIQCLVSHFKQLRHINPISKNSNRSFEKWHMTDLFQSMIDADHKLKPIIIHKGWLEFDTEKDYEIYQDWYNDGSLKRFIRL